MEEKEIPMTTTPGLSVSRELTNAERDNIETFIEVDVDFSQSIEEIGAAGNYDLDVMKRGRCYPRLFGGPGSGKKLVEIGLLRPLGEAKGLKDLTRQLEFFNGLLAQDEAGYRYRFASAAETLTLGAAQPELQRSQTLLTGAIVLTSNYSYFDGPPCITPYWLVLLGTEDHRGVTVTDMAIGVNREYRLLIVKESEADFLGNQIIADAISSDEVFSKYLVSSHELVIGDQDMAQAISAAEYVYADPNVTADNFPVSGQDKTVKVDLLDFKRCFLSAEEVVSVVETVNVWLTNQNARYRYRFMNVREQFSLQASQPDLQLEYFIAALGSVWVDAEGKKKYPVLGRYNTDKVEGRCLKFIRLRNLILKSFDSGFGNEWLFGVVREEIVS